MMASAEVTQLYDVLRAVPLLWSLIGRHASRNIRLVDREARNLHDAACLVLNVNVGRASSLLKASLQLGRAAILNALDNLLSHGCHPLNVTVTAECEATLCAVLREAARSATRVAVLGSPRLSGDRLGATLASCAPALQHLVLEVSEPSTAKAVDHVLTEIGPRLRSLELRLSARATLPAVGLEECTALDELRLVVDTHLLAPLGPLRMRGDEAPPAVAALASLGPHLRSLELTGSALPRLLDPPHRLAGLSVALTALTRLRVDMPPGFLAPQEPAAAPVAPPPQVAVGCAAAAAELRWRAVPLAASLASLTELHLGRSYECTMYDMTVLARAPLLSLLGCRNVVLPPVWASAAAAAGVRCGLPASPPVVPFPPLLRELQVRRLPSAPVLACLASLRPPGLQVLKCRAFDKAAAAAAAAIAASAATAAAAAAAAADVGSRPPADSAGAGRTDGAGVTGTGGGQEGPPLAEPERAALAPSVGAAAAAKGLHTGGGIEGGLRLALVGSSCESESVEADPWVADVALAAFRLIRRLLFAHAPPLPSPSPPPVAHSDGQGRPTGCGDGSPAPQPRPRGALPALLIRPFERRGSGGGGGTTLRGPYAGSWLSALAPLGEAGLDSLQLRNFELGAGDLQLLGVAVPELRVCELHGCPAAAEDVLRLRDWLTRPRPLLGCGGGGGGGWAEGGAGACGPGIVGGSLRSDLHDQLLLKSGTGGSGSGDGGRGGGG